MLELQFFLLLVLFQSSITQRLVSAATTKNQDESYCDNADCRKVAEEIKAIIDPKIDPCDDFHRFVCGGLLKNDSKFDFPSRLDRDQDELGAFLAAYVTSEDSSADSDALKTLKVFYRACVDEDAIERDGVQPFVHLIHAVMGAEGHNNNNSDWLDSFQWEDAMVKARRLGLPFEWFFKVELDSPNKRVVVRPPIHVAEPGNKTAILDAFGPIAKAFGAHLHDELISFGQVLDFQSELSKMVKKSLNAYLYPSNYEQLPPYPSNLLELLSNITDLKLEAENVNTSDEFKRFASELSQLLQTTEKRTVALYVSWYLMQEMATLMPRTVREAIWKISYQFDIGRTPGILEKSPRSQHCLFTSHKIFNFVPEVEYLKRHVRDPRKPALKKIVSHILSLYRAKLPGFRQLNLTVAESTVGSMDVGSIDKLFLIQAFNYSSNKVLHMAVERRKHYLDAYFATFLSEEDQQGLVLEYEEIFDSEYLIPKRDDTVIPIALYQNSSLFNAQFPQYMNFGGFGLATALFLFSHRSNPHPMVCRPDTILKENEEVADGIYYATLGVELAVKAYEESRRDANQPEPEPKLPDLDYSPAQMIFIQSQSIACFKKVEGRPTFRFGGDDRGVIRKIILETARNSPAFAKAFACPVGSPMNPERKCLENVWSSGYTV